MIIGLVGLIGEGKGTVSGRLLDHHGYQKVSFAATLKDACAVIFSWDREMLEGETPESREWREQVDPWWADRLGMPHLTPRWVLQYVGTEVMRGAFHDEIWVASLERRLAMSPGRNVVISDVRFMNEVEAITSAGGLVVRVKRGPDPEWWTLAFLASKGDPLSAKKLDELGVHPSEWSWASCHPDLVITNDGTLEELYQSVDALVSSFS